MISRYQTEIAFGLTLLIESGILASTVKRPLPRLLLYSALVNGLTWPLATYGLQRFALPYWPVELAVWIAEAVLLKLLLDTTAGRAALLALAMNLPTALIGWYFSNGR